MLVPSAPFLAPALTLACVAAGLASAAAGVQAAPAQLNDTGLLECIAPSTGTVPCAGTGQDGEFGRDVRLPDDADGRAGFRFTRVCNSGAPAGKAGCAAEPAPGNGPNDWGCTRDEVTHLLWEVKTAGGGLRDGDRGFTFYTPGYDPDGLYGSRKDVAGYLAAVNDAGLCGQRDWRLPTPSELVGLADMGLATVPSIDLGWFPNTVANGYWAAGSVQGQAFDEQLAWQADFSFGFGSISPQFRSSPRPVRLVRGGDTAASRYQISESGQEVLDRSTGLQWRRCVEGQSFDGSRCSGTVLHAGWLDALDHARAQAAATGQGWRLPNAKELASLMDHEQARHIDTRAFPAVRAAAGQWTSSALLVYRLPRCVSFADGTTSLCNAEIPLALRLVRDAAR